MAPSGTDFPGKIACFQLKSSETLSYGPSISLLSESGRLASGSDELREFEGSSWATRIFIACKRTSNNVLCPIRPHSGPFKPAGRLRARLEAGLRAHVSLPMYSTHHDMFHL